jgi:leucyl/phenylalanyl-tRNA--protein transferase
MSSLSPEGILEAYRRGLFPMGDPRTGRIAWYEADPRGVIPLEAAHVPRRLRRYMRGFEFTVDRDFDAVVAGCARPRTWISRGIREAYGALHRLGRAHSVEARRGGRLVGGLYGVRLGAAFMAESMFHEESNASGACLARLIDHLRERGFLLLDIQEVLPNTARFGAVEIPRTEYLRRLAEALRRSPSWLPFAAPPPG